MSLGLDYKISLNDAASNPLQNIIALTQGADTALGKLQSAFGNMSKIQTQMKSVSITNEHALEQFAAMEKQQNLVRNSTNAFGNSIHTLHQRVKLLQGERDLIDPRNINTIRRYNQEINNLNGQIQRLSTINGGFFKTKFSEAFQQIPFAGLLTNPLVMAGAGIMKSIQLGMQNQMQRASFDTMLGSKDLGQKMFDDIAKYGKESPYEKIGLADNAQKLLSFGVAADKVMPSLKMIGDVAMGDQNKMSSLTLAFSQMSSTGRLMGQDLLQFVNAGFNPLQEISKMTGESMGSLKQKMEDGAISAQMVENAFKHATEKGGMFYGMADKMGQTLGGRWSTLMDSMAELGLKLFTVIEPIVFPIVNGLIAGIDWIGQKFTAMVEAFNQGSTVGLILATVLGGLAVGMAASALWSGILTAQTWLAETAFTAFNAVLAINPIFLAVAAIAALAAGVYYCWNKFEGFRKFLYGFWETTKQIFSNVGSFFLKIFQPIGEIIEAFQKGDWAGVAVGAAKMGANLITMPAQFAKYVMDGELTKGVGSAYAKGEALGAKSFAEDKKSRGVSSPSTAMASGGKPEKLGAGAGAIDGKKAGAGGHGGGSGKIVTIHIGKLVETLQVHTTNLKEGAEEIRKIVRESIVAAVSDAETAIAIG